MTRLALALAILVLIGSAPLQANTLVKRLADSGLSPEDVEIMMDRALSLYGAGTARVGDRSDWRNDRSGTAGSVEVLAVEGNCVILGHLFTTAKTREAQGLRVRRCKAADGSWQLE